MKAWSGLAISVPKRHGPVQSVTAAPVRGPDPCGTREPAPPSGARVAMRRREAALPGPAIAAQRAREPITAAATIMAAASAMPPVSGRPVTTSSSVVDSSGVR